MSPLNQYLLRDAEEEDDQLDASAKASSPLRSRMRRTALRTRATHRRNKPSGGMHHRRNKRVGW